MGVKGVWKQSVCLCTAGSSGCSLEFPIQTVLGVALTTPKIKNTSVYNLLLGCFLLMLVSGPAVGIHALVCVGGTKLEILRNCSLPPPNCLNFWRIDWKGPHRRHGQELPASHTGWLIDWGTSETWKPVLSFLAIILSFLDGFECKAHEYSLLGLVFACGFCFSSCQGRAQCTIRSCELCRAKHKNLQAPVSTSSLFLHYCGFMYIHLPGDLSSYL